MKTPSPLFHHGRITIALSLVAGSVTLAGCALEPPGPAPIYSRLPASQSGLPDGTRPLTEQERQRYDAIDHQVMAEQNQAIAAEAAAQAWAQYYSPPVTVSGGYYGGWGRGWGGGIGYGYAPGWGWGW